MAGGSEKAARARRRAEWVFFGASWSALLALYAALRAWALPARPLWGGVAEALALILLQALLGWAAAVRAGDLDGSAEYARDYFVLAGGALLLHAWPRLGSSWLLVLPPAVFVAHTVAHFRGALGGLPGAAAAPGGDEGAGADNGGGGGGGARGMTEKARAKKQRQFELQQKRFGNRGGMMQAQQRKGAGAQGAEQE